MAGLALAMKLKANYQQSESEDKITQVILFRITHSSEILMSGISCRDLVILAQLKPSNSTETQKGVNFARYVEL